MRSHLISRAAENQRFLLAANVADLDQHCPTMAISPRGEVHGELAPGATGVLRVTLDLDRSPTGTSNNAGTSSTCTTPPRRLLLYFLTRNTC